jgi:hypothetical protein
MASNAQWDRAERLLTAANDAARGVRNVYITFLLLGTYIATIIGSTTDEQLLTISPVTLPILNVQLPILGFYIFVPWLFLLFHFNLLLQVYLLAFKLHPLDTAIEVLPNVTAREEFRIRLFALPISHMLIGRHRYRRMRLLLGLMVYVTMLLFPLILLLWAQIRFLPYHNETITWSHRAVVLLDLVLLWLFWLTIMLPAGQAGSAFPILTQWQQTRAATRRRLRFKRLRWSLGLTGMSLVVLAFSFFVAVIPQEYIETLAARVVPENWLLTDDRRAEKYLILTYWLLDRRSWQGEHAAPFHRNMQLVEALLIANKERVLDEVRNKLQSDDTAVQAKALGKVRGLSLQGRDLRFANFDRAILVKSDLRQAQLQGADLWQAQLQGASLWQAQLQGADLLGAELQGADLRQASIGGARFGGTELRLSDLRGLVRQPLDRELLAALEAELANHVENTELREGILRRLQTASGKPDTLDKARSANDALCDDPSLFPSCLTESASTQYYQKLSQFLARLGCENTDVARGIAGRIFSYREEVHSFGLPLASALLDPQCRGGAGLPDGVKKELRETLERWQSSSSAAQEQ